MPERAEGPRQQIRRMWGMPRLCEEKRPPLPKSRQSSRLELWMAADDQWPGVTRDFSYKETSEDLKNSRVSVCSLCSQQVMSEIVEILNLRYLGDVQVEVLFKKSVFGHHLLVDGNGRYGRYHGHSLGFHITPQGSPALSQPHCNRESSHDCTLGFSLPGHS